MKFAPLDTFSRLRTVSLVTRSLPVSPFWRLWMRRGLAPPEFRTKEKIKKKLEFSGAI
jgi:hypothetical protein